VHMLALDFLLKPNQSYLLCSFRLIYQQF